MKQKFTLDIADLQISVVTDASPEEVHRITGILDRKMREIYLKSRCPKTEAALLCAMEFVAERLTLQEQTSELENRCEKYAMVVDTMKERCADQAEELDRLRNENSILRSLLTRPGEEPPAEEAPAAIAPDPISPTEFLSKVADAQVSEPTDVTDAAEPTPAPAEEVPTRSRVGAMFDLLSFNEEY